ncbi:helix-turn-helix transcriptional regulator [Lactobacillus sp. Marseille-P7033]|nr:helix-turn-helix transcriptional regulator [Lactobacillus sp. Marseille-P7033]NGC78327.1 helix-turn-helix transcriptional regulator [Limosilactobacillus reuteri]
MNNLSQNIVKQRHALHLTQEKLAERAGISINFLSKLERSASKSVSAETLQRLANALEISMEELLNGNGNNQQQNFPGPYEAELNKLLLNYDQRTREQLCKGLIAIIKSFN